MSGHKLNRWVRYLQVKKWAGGTFSKCKHSFVARPPVCSPLKSLGEGEAKLQEEWPDYKVSEVS